MNEPPISSPSGGPTTSLAATPSDQSLPLALKILVGFSLLFVASNLLQVLNLVHIMAVSHIRSGVTGKALWFFIIFRVVRMGFLVGLLRRSQLCWWGMQIFNAYNFLVFARSLIFTGTTMGGVISRSIPIGLDMLLFAYLLLPTSRQLFFSKKR